MSDSDEQDQIRSMAERIARRVAQSSSVETNDSAPQSVDEVAALRASLNAMQQRLAQIEARIAPGERGVNSKQNDAGLGRQAFAANISKATPNATQTSSVSSPRAPFLSGMYVPATHPSAERFGVDEAAAVSELVDFFEGAKTCELEPGGKPCDHCAMCSSRGF